MNFTMTVRLWCFSGKVKIYATTTFGFYGAISYPSATSRTDISMWARNNLVD